MSLALDRLGKRFGARTAVEGLSFDVAAGEVFGLLGPNGAGKTTTVRMLAGLIAPSEGDARVCGLAVREGGERLRAQVGLLTEQPGLYDRLSAKDNLRFFIKLHGLAEAPALARASEYLARFGLSGREDEPVGGFSKGMRQKLALVRTLVHDPKVVFLDEPTSGLDPESALTVREAIAELATTGKTVVLCSHNLAEVERLCQRVAGVKNRLVALAKVDALRKAKGALRVRLQGPAERFRNALKPLPFAANALFEPDAIEVPLFEDAQAAQVLEALVQAGAKVFEARRGERALEEAYLELVEGGAA